MKEKLIIVTGNELKFRQLAHVLNEFFDCTQGVFKTYEIQGTPKEILEDKMRRAYEHFNAPILVDDTSVHFDDLNGFPGSYIRDFLCCLPSYEMGKKFKGSKMKVASRLGFMKNPQEIIIGEGIVEGVAVDPKVQDPGIREFENFFQPDGLSTPLIEFTPEETLQYSHRGKAVKDLLKKLGFSQ